MCVCVSLHNTHTARTALLSELKTVLQVGIIRLKWSCNSADCGTKSQGRHTGGVVRCVLVNGRCVARVDATCLDQNANT